MTQLTLKRSSVAGRDAGNLVMPVWWRRIGCLRLATPLVTLVTTLVVAVLAADAPSLWRAPITQLIGAAEPPPPVGEKSKEKVGRQGAEKATGDLTETAVEKSVDEGTIDQAVAERRADKSADREAADVVDSLDSPRTKAARERAKLLHEVFATTLNVIHERYFHGDRAAVPARAMEDVFQQLQRNRNIQARWIGVNARTMSLPHEPKDDFERAAAKAIREGKGEYEAVENGFYRRAEAIPLDGGCLSCHGTFGAEVKSPRFAGLVLRISLKDKR